jgi:hypothetical protein
MYVRTFGYLLYFWNILYNEVITEQYYHMPNYTKCYTHMRGRQVDLLSRPRAHRVSVVRP